MATLNELGRNSSSVTYGPYATGQDMFPTLQAVDTWYRNDTWQGTAYGASGQATLTGISTIWTTQARVNDYVYVAGTAYQVLSTPTSDSSLTLNANLPTTISSATPARIISLSPFQRTNSQGYLSTIVRGSTTGTVSVSSTANTTTITGTGTYFLSEATNSVTLITSTNTVAIDTNGVITGSGFVSGAPSNQSLQVGDSIAVTVGTSGAAAGSIYYFIVASVTNDTTASVTIPPTIAIPSGSTLQKATNGVSGRYISINGRIRQITAIASNTSMTINTPLDFTDTNLRYKVFARGTMSNASAAGGTLYGSVSVTSTGTTALTVNTAPTGVLMPGAVLVAPIGVGTITTGTTIVNQQYGVISGSATSQLTSGTANSGTNQFTLSSTNASILVGHLVSGNGAAIAGIPAGTYVTGISGTTLTLSQNLTQNVGATTLYFYVPGSTGVYTTSSATTFTTAQLYFSTVQVTAGNYYWDLGYNNVSSTTATPYMYQTSQLDQIWIGDEVRTINFSTYSGAVIANAATYGYITDYAGFSGSAIGVLRQTVYQIPFKREDSYINGNLYGTTTAFASDFRVGDDLIIDGTECTITQIVSNTQLKIDRDFTHTTANNSGGAATASTTYSSGGAPAATTFVVNSASNIVIGQLVTGTGLPQGTYVTNLSSTTVTVSNAFTVQATGTYNFYNGTTIYKKNKLHGYTLEGTREGGVGIPTGNAAVFASTCTGSSTNLTVTSGLTGTILPGMQILPGAASGVYTQAGTVTGLTYIVNQQFGSGASINTTTTANALVGQNVLALTTSASITVGMIIQSAAATALTNVPFSTYVIGIAGNTVYLSNNFTTQLNSGATVYFIAAGGVGTYTTSVATTPSGAYINFYPPYTNKFSQGTSIVATNGTVYPLSTTSITVATAPTVGQYNFVKISGAGGMPQVLTGQVTFVNSVVTGINTLFTTQLHVGAEIIVSGQYLTVVAINSDTQLYVQQSSGTTGVIGLPTPIYRSVPLYTYMTSVSGSVITLATPIKNNLYAGILNPPTVTYPSTGADFLEYVYSAPNYSADQGTATQLNQSLDRKYVAFRYWPLFQSTNLTPTTTATISTAFGAYATPVYERWTASYAQSHGVGINQADLSGGVMSWGTQATTTFTQQMPVVGSLQVNMGIQGLATTGYPNLITALASGTAGLANSTYSVSTGSGWSGPAPIVGSLYGIYDITSMTQVQGGTLFLFGNRRYFAIQGRSSANVQTQWVGCIEFERAQPEDVGTGTAAGTGITFGGQLYGGSQLAQGAFNPTTATPGFSQVLQYTTGTAPWPCFAYFNGNRMPTGSQQIPTLPQITTGVAAPGYPIHGCVLACPRVRDSAGDLVGFNAHIYSALTVTTGRWGHQVEFGNYGTYNPAYAGTTLTPTSATLPVTPNMIPQVHMGQIVPVYTNIYNSKRFMFSPVVVLGPAYDPDVRGRMYGMKVLPSNLGTLMDTVSITINNNSGTSSGTLGSGSAVDYFYNTGGTAADHWVLTTPPSTTLTTAYPGQQTVVTNRFTLTPNVSSIQQSWRSLEDTGTQATNTGSLTTNNFRFALPA